MTLLEQLQSDQTNITAILKAHYEQVKITAKADIAIGMHYGEYMGYQKDALRALDSLIEDLKNCE